jgi:hypothetical protein
MNFDTCFKTSKVILMEGALGERLKREYNIIFDEYVAMAGLVYSVDSKQAMQTIFQQYLTIAENHDLPLLLQHQHVELIKNESCGRILIEKLLRKMCIFCSK